MQQIQLMSAKRKNIYKILRNRFLNPLDMKKSLHQQLSIMKHMKMHLKTFKQQICINSLMKMEEF